MGHYPDLAGAKQSQDRPSFHIDKRALWSAQARGSEPCRSPGAGLGQGLCLWSRVSSNSVETG